MNTPDSKPSKNVEPSPKNPIENQPTAPITPPLSSPNEPTRAYPTDSSRTYSSDPSQYAYPDKSNEETSKKYTAEPIDNVRLIGDEMRSSAQAQKEKKNFEEQARQAWGNKEHLKKTEKVYNSSNIPQMVTYILLVLGLLILLFFSNLLGGLIVGIVAGYYFTPQIIYYIRHFDQIWEGPNHLPYLVLGALALSLLITTPGIFIGTLLIAAFRQVMSGPTT